MSIEYGEPNIEETSFSKDWNNMNVEERQSFEDALIYYADSIIIEDLRMGEYNTNFKEWVIDKTWDDPLPREPIFDQQIERLNKFKDVYLKYYWNIHSKSNNRVCNQNINWVRNHEQSFVEKLSNFCKAKWQTEPMRVDISFHSKRDIPYTTLYPKTHIIMDSKNTPLIQGVWFELLLHESSHHLISSSTGFVGGAISNVAEVQQVKVNNQLWHAYLFYFSGKVAKELLSKAGVNNYVLYGIQPIFWTYVSSPG